MNLVPTVLHCATPQSAAYVAPKGKPEDRFTSQPYTTRSNCTRAMKKHAAETGGPLQNYQINDLDGGRFNFEVHLPKADPLAIPKCLDRIGGKTKEQIAAERDALNRKHSSTEIKMPKIKNPTGRKKTGLGQAAVGERQSAGAKPKTPAKGKTERRSTTSKPRAAGKVGEPKEGSKMATLIAMLKRAKGVTNEELQKELDWQAHSVRGAIATLRTKQGLDVQNEVIEGRGRVYKIAG